ncbi:MAG: hypothetical protein JNM07_11585 [Phycisphaerae bacterium]|nr:hypothetical protein [Phycisphaerae bacterium]
MKTRNATLILIAGSVLAVAGNAMAVQTLQYDTNNLRSQATPSGGGSLPFSTTFTGTVNVTDDANARIAGLILNGLDQGVGPISSANFDFLLTITLVNGGVTGGSISVATMDNTYSASILPGSGTIKTQAGQGFQIDGLTFNGNFTGMGLAGSPGNTTVVGVDISAFMVGYPLVGSFLNFAFSPNSSGTDANADVDLYVQVPLPGAACLGLVGMGIVAGRRRR